MEVTECTKILLGRIEMFEPENSTKIIGYLLLNHTNEEIIGYAFGSEKQIISLINEAKCYLSSPRSVIPPQFTPQFMPFPVNFTPPKPPQFLPNYSLFGIPPNILESPNFNFNPQLCENYTEPPQLCHYYYTKGHCTIGPRCRFIHDPNLNFNLGNLERLEMKIREILISRGRVPVSIALLPMIYFDMYGEVLQAEGYLTERQRHGKPGCNLTKLLARLKSICIIERPHGQHSIVLLEDLHKYMDHRLFQRDSIGSSHQIYLTFPSESTFTEADVENYFKQYGPVREVRIPKQERRMFGFVSFVFPETVRIILTRSHPHYIGGARVLVKPYKEKSKLSDRRRRGKGDLAYYVAAPNFVDSSFDPFAMSAEFNHAGFLENQMVNEREMEIALERRERHLVEMSNVSIANQLTNEPSNNLVSPDSLEFVQDELSKLNIEIGRQKEQEDWSGEIELPESPFA